MVLRPWLQAILVSLTRPVSTVPVPVMPRFANSGATPVSSRFTLLSSTTQSLAVVTALRENSSVRKPPSVLALACGGADDAAPRPIRTAARAAANSTPTSTPRHPRRRVNLGLLPSADDAPRLLAVPSTVNPEPNRLRRRSPAQPGGVMPGAAPHGRMTRVSTAPPTTTEPVKQESTGPERPALVLGSLIAVAAVANLGLAV